jgi:deferrochelatase/peroxidase EfeB
MTARDDESRLRATRRGLLTATAGLMAAGSAMRARAAETQPQPGTAIVDPPGGVEPFWGPRQGGIATPMQGHTYFAAFDLVTTKRDDVAALLARWTEAAARMTAGEPVAAYAAEDYPSSAAPAADSTEAPAADSGDVLGLPASRLSVTFGFGAGLFSKGGTDRYGLAKHRPEALVDMPNFPGDQLVEQRSGGDLSIQACADDPQIAFHAVRQLARLAYETAEIRWVQAGFMADFGAHQTPRNLMGFKDGTGNIPVSDPAAMDQFVWVGPEGPAWMQGGSYVVARRSRIALEHWDRTNVGFQEQTLGRHKLSGAPLGKKNEFDPLDLDAVDDDGNPVLPENSHARLATAATNDGARILRRSYSYNDGVNFTAERWPPWRQAMEYDAGLLFICYQRDPRTGFIKIFDKMAKFDMMNQFVTNTSSALFACPPGVAEGRSIGQALFDAA